MGDEYREVICFVFNTTGGMSSCYGYVQKNQKNLKHIFTKFLRPIIFEIIQSLAEFLNSVASLHFMFFKILFRLLFSSGLKAPECKASA